YRPWMKGQINPTQKAASVGATNIGNHLFKAFSTGSSSHFLFEFPGNVMIRKGSITAPPSFIFLKISF
ncbi:MAG: hypothetical protein II313_00580, partial [Anaerotignum sp.]|nr:hypothetical protein [Anaerotignum sp.]